jgi:hypothetical protein
VLSLATGQIRILPNNKVLLVPWMCFNRQNRQKLEMCFMKSKPSTVWILTKIMRVDNIECRERSFEGSDRRLTDWWDTTSRLQSGIGPVWGWEKPLSERVIYQPPLSLEEQVQPTFEPGTSDVTGARLWHLFSTWAKAMREKENEGKAAMNYNKIRSVSIT